jgi:hypothetical protein
MKPLTHKESIQAVELAMDKRQKDQQEFCEQHQVPYVTTAEEALNALGDL